MAEALTKPRRENAVYPLHAGVEEKSGLCIACLPLVVPRELSGVERAQYKSLIACARVLPNLPVRNSVNFSDSTAEASDS